MLTLVIQVNSDLSTIFVSRWKFLHPYPLPFLLSYLVGSLAEFKRRFKKNLLYLKKSQGSEIANLSKICLFCRCYLESWGSYLLFLIFCFVCHKVYWILSDNCFSFCLLRWSCDFCPLSIDIEYCMIWPLAAKQTGVGWIN